MPIPITQIKLKRLRMKLNHPFTTSFGEMRDKDFFITEAIDTEERSGFGESVAFPAPWYTEETVETNAHVMKDFLIPLLHENTISHPHDVREIFSPIKRNNMAKAALEGAIWDLDAKRKNQTLAEVLGGHKSEIDAGISIGIQPTIDDLLQKVGDHIQQGYKRIKLKIKPGSDVKTLREVRKQFPDIPIMADANSAYTLQDLNRLKQLDEFNLMMIEQPLAHDDITDHAQLQALIQTPICLDESIHSAADARKAIDLGSCRVINVKIGRVGGLTEALAIHDLCRERGIDVWCGGMLEAGVGRAHNIALTTLPQFNLPGDTAGSSLYWERDIIQPEVIVHNGTITAPDKPGIGYEIDQEALEAYMIDEMVFDL
ncbi:o-succinylbenzoate synthase [Barrientosiimonas marina]|uniref:o-succinylbenzoate synthase n=1 Tax=Lentibacillus kimchii TaxID=1542911 RepID=A0ABW2USX4_9BACI